VNLRLCKFKDSVGSSEYAVYYSRINEIVSRWKDGVVAYL
jgi:hypothetical protein